MTETEPRGGWTSAVFFSTLVVGSSFALDPAVPRPFLVPKVFWLETVAAAALVVWAILALRRRAPLTVSVVEALLLVGLVLTAASDPGLLGRRDSQVLPLGAALIVVTFLTRQLFEGHSELDVGGSHRRLGLVGGDLLHATWINGVALALLGLRQAMNAGGFRYPDGLAKTPMVGTLGTANAYGALVALGILAALAAASQARALRTRVLLGSAAALSAFALVANGSRGAILGLVVGAGGWLLARAWRSGRPWGSYLRRHAVGVALAVVVAVSALVASLAMVDPGSSGGRLLVWRISLPMIVENPWNGVGGGRFGAEYPAYQARFFTETANLRWAHKAAELEHPHSDVLLPFVESGLAGGLVSLSLWTLALVWLVRAAIRTRGPVSGGYAALVGLLLVVLVHGTVDSIRLVIPVAVVAHGVLGLVPAPTMQRRPGRGAWIVILLLAMGYAGFRATQAARQYGAYHVWFEGNMRSGAEAVPYLRSAQRLLPSRPRLARDLGAALVEDGQEEEGIPLLESALEGGAGPAVRLSLSDAYLGSGRLDEAERHAALYLDAFPDRLRPRLLLGRIHLARGEHERARAELARCIRQETRIRSAAVEVVAREAEAIWRGAYEDPPPRPLRGR